jgi:hypothetical protein
VCTGSSHEPRDVLAVELVVLDEELDVDAAAVVGVAFATEAETGAGASVVVVRVDAPDCVTVATAASSISPPASTTLDSAAPSGGPASQPAVSIVMPANAAVIAIFVPA